jgi:radical SAM protein with 4Fe4S-binding SPASM domain
VLTKNKSAEILPYLTYLRVNFSAGERKRYAEIMGTKEKSFDRVCENIKDMVSIKKKNNLKCTIGMQMVLMPKDEDQIIPLAKLGKELRPDYAIIKHCSDNEDGDLGIEYGAYEKLYGKLREAENYSDDTYKVVIKWSKIGDKGTRSYQRCYGAPFMLQISGSGLIAPCGMLFNDRYKKFHIGNITEQRFKDIWSSERYWEVMRYLSSPEFNAQKMCGSLCLQHKVNEALDKHLKNETKISKPRGAIPPHVNFI